MNTRKLIAAAMLGLFAVAARAAAVETAAQATAVFDGIRTAPDMLKLYCEQNRLQGDSVAAFMNRDNAAVSRIGQRISAIQAELAGYKEAVGFVSDKAGDMAFFKSAEGKALDQAQKNLAAACGR